MLFLVSNWKLVLMGLLVAALGVQEMRVRWCKEARHKDQVSYEAKIISLEGSLQAQNEAIAQLGRETKARKARVEKALQEATRKAQDARTEAERLRHLAKPENAPSASECPAGDAVKAIRQGLSRP